MDKINIITQIKVFIEQEFPNQGVELKDSTNLLEEWFIDSLAIVATVLFLEKSFGIDVSRADVNGTNFKDIAALADFVSKRLAN